jgi:hypothetical protein
MRYRGATEIVLIILAVIGALVLLGMLSMGLMHITLTGWRLALCR